MRRRLLTDKTCPSGGWHAQNAVRGVAGVLVTRHAHSLRDWACHPVEVRPSGTRSGVLSLEVVLVLPVLLVLLCGLFEISMLMFARSELVEASRAGARLGTLSGVTFEEVQWEATRAAGRRLGSVIEVDAQLGRFSGDEVIVTVRAPMSAAAPDLLWPVGFGLQGRDLITQTRMRKE